MDTEETPLYREAWLKEHQPVRIGATLLIGPPGTRAVAGPDDRVIELELFPNTPAAGVVFGTGTHPTTRLVLELLEEVLQPGDRVLDVGTGSGILALAAARLGAAAVLAVDIDPLAARSAETNVRLNGLEGAVHVRQGGIEVVEGCSCDLVLANILSPVLRELAPALRHLLRPDGLLIASGIVAVEGEEIEEMFIGCGFRRRDSRGEGDWKAFVLQRESAVRSSLG